MLDTFLYIHARSVWRLLHRRALTRRLGLS